MYQDHHSASLTATTLLRGVGVPDAHLGIKTFASEGVAKHKISNMSSTVLGIRLKYVTLAPKK